MLHVGAAAISTRGTATRPYFRGICAKVDEALVKGQLGTELWEDSDWEHVAGIG
jgi:hypothetical protein